MTTQPQPLEDLLEKSPYDDLDRRIDRALGRVGALVRTLFIIGVLAFVGLFVLAPHWEEWGQYILFGLYLVFQLFFAIMFMIVQFVALFWFLGKPRIYWVMPGETGVSFKDYKGNPEVLESARQVVTLVRGVKEFKAMGGEAIRGLLLVGSPGTGKSYLGQCIATEAGVPFGYLSAPSIQGMFWGMDMLRIMTLYGKARKLANKFGACILFIDEIDAIGKSRVSQGPGMGMGGMMFGAGGAALNELLNQMDPLPRDSWKGRLLRKFGLRRKRAEMNPILTMGATNIAEVLDPALLRPGRFDRKITVDLPDADGRQEIIEYYLSRVKHDNLSKEERRRIAYHETGHAFAMVKCLPRERLHKVTIIRHGSALGLAQHKPNEEHHTRTKDEYLADIQVSLASRAAEQLFLGIEMSGAHHDLQNATAVADAVIRHFGMNGCFT